MKQGMVLGRLVSITVHNPKTGRSTTRQMRGKYLATSNGKDLLIVVAKRKSNKRLSAAALRRHKRFHKAKPSEVWEGEHPDPQGKLQQTGLLKSLIYYVPRSFGSPEKKEINWDHAFGDTGHEGKKYPPKYYPALMKDARGNLYIKRRPGNIYKTTDWIVG